MRGHCLHFEIWYFVAYLLISPLLNALHLLKMILQESLGLAAYTCRPRQQSVKSTHNLCYPSRSFTLEVCLHSGQGKRQSRG